MHRLRLPRSLLALVLMVPWLRPVESAQTPADWNQWRGPNRDGKLPSFRPPAQWPAQLTQSWKLDVGLGHSSPIVVGQAVYVFAREGEEEVTRRLELGNGKVVWQDRSPAPYEMHPAARGHGPGPKSTPTYAGGRLYTLGISGILSCLDASSGKVLWRHDFKGEFQVTSPLYGAATSPLVDRGLVICHVGGNDSGALTAFDARTGQVRWRWTGDGPAYSSPIAVDLGGVRQIVTQSQKLCIGVAAQDGKLLWSLPFTTAFTQNIFTPVVAGDRIILGGMLKPTFALRVRKEGAEWKPEQVWETTEAAFYMNTPVLSDGRLYGFSQRQSGQLVTLDAATGQVRWTGEARLSTNAQVLDGGAVVLVLTVDADLFVFKKEGATLTQAARYEVAGSPTWATPVVVGRRILVKDLNSLISWELR